MFYKIDALKNLAKLAAKCLLWSHFIVKLQVIYMHHCKERTPSDMFPVNISVFFTEYLRTTSKVFPSIDENVLYDLSNNLIKKTNLADKAWFSLFYPAEH